MKIGCALLAAGAGVRFGGGKLLHEVEGEPMIARALRLFGSVPFAARVCVTRAEADEIRRMAQSGGFFVAVNPDPGRGVGTSVSLATNALRAVEPALDGILYAVSDQPYLTKESVMRLLDAFEEEPERIVSLSSAGTRGNPAIFPRAMFRELTELAQDVGGGAVIRSHPELLRLVEAGAARELTDIDTLESI
ncbi:MAG: nucleotidyltransferase family protein [Clostridiales bacterium]|nr:nucleotidyltransferase family protein [Clostridiales bacterium]